MRIQFIRVKRVRRGVWCVDHGHEVKRLWWKSKRWQRYITIDDGNTWSTMTKSGVGDLDCDGWSTGYVLHPQSDMKVIDLLIGAIGPYVRAAGLAEQATALRARQEKYWAQQRWSREQAESARQGRSLGP